MKERLKIKIFNRDFERSMIVKVERKGKEREERKRIILTALLFFIVTMPFRKFFGLTGLTEVRPASAFSPVFGLMFGVPGALGCALGNPMADYCSGYSLQVCILGFAAQFLYGYFPYLMWYGKRGRQAEESISLGRLCYVLKYIGIMIADSLFMALVLGTILQTLKMGKLISRDTLLLFLNNIVFCLVLGIPIIIFGGLLTARNKRKVLTLNVRFILFFLVLSITSAVLEGISAYKEMQGNAVDAVEQWNRIYIWVSIDFFILCGMAVWFLGYLEKHISIPLEILADIARAYADRQRTEDSGCIDNSEAIEQCNRLTACHGETGHLAKAFKKMMLDVDYYIQDITKITAEKERINTELQVASALQADMLPDPARLFTEHREFSIRARMLPAKEVGGDFYDCFLLDDDNMVFLTADVSGKGVPAALFMVIAKTLIQSQCRNTQSPARAFTQANAELCKNNPNGMFVTAWMGILNVRTGKVTYVNAGHTRTLLRQGESYSYVEGKSGFVLAGMEDTQYVEQELYLNPGDALFLYTDGVTEANDAGGMLYGESRLLHRMNQNPKLEPEETITAVWEDVKAFQGKAEQFDDITMLSFRYNGNGYRVKRGRPDMRCISEFTGFVENILAEADVAKETVVKIRGAMDEIFSNICYYSQAAGVEVGCRIKGGEISLYFEDDGFPYNPLERQNPDIGLQAEDRSEGGLGIYLVTKRMDRVEYEYVGGKNRLWIGKGYTYAGNQVCSKRGLAGETNLSAFSGSRHNH